MKCHISVHCREGGGQNFLLNFGVRGRKEIDQNKSQKQSKIGKKNIICMCVGGEQPVSYWILGVGVSI